MKTYQYYSKGCESNVKLSYLDGMLSRVEIEEPKIAQSSAGHFILREKLFLESCEKHKVMVTEIEHEVTFEMFWEAYKYKQSGRIPTLKAWDKLSKAEQVAAFDYLPKYFTHLKVNVGQAKAYGATYLNSKRYL